MVPKTIALLFTILFVSACSATTVPINGFTLGSASFHNGKVVFVKDLTWELHRNDHPIEKLHLVGRDQWSVYLCDAAKNSIQVDYWTRWIKKNNVNTYQITSATVGIINGRNIGAAYYHGGSFKETTVRGSWDWTNSGQNSPVSLVETDRDEWSVYLKTQDGKMLVQIDYHRKWIRFNPSSSISYDVFQITGADHSTTSYRSSC